MRHSGKILPTRWILPAALALTLAVYWPGLSGSWLFDDYPNIVDNPGVQPHAASVASLVRAALSSPASEFKRPLASLSFAANYLAGGLTPWGWKLFNLIVHLLNGALVFVLARGLLAARPSPRPTEATADHDGTVAALIATCWMLLPINLTAVLYVVQREESMANLFVLLGLLGYVDGRRRMLHPQPTTPARRGLPGWGGFALCVASLVSCTAIGLLAKETAVMLPLYAFLTEAIVFGFVGATPLGTARPRRDGRIPGLFVVILLLPLLIGLYWLLPQVLAPSQWATRDFTLGTRLLTEARVVCDYIAWTLLPAPGALSFYHDQFPISTGPLSPPSTLAALGLLASLAWLIARWRKRHPMVALGIAWFLGCQLLTGTILPLELVYEHRNYFASLGLMLALVPWLAGWREPATNWLWPRRITLAALALWWGLLTTLTAYAWGDPLRLAQELAARAPDSPRAQYELGRTYILYSHYDPASPYTALAYAPLERAAALPESSILPQQALIFMNSRMGLPLKPQWWDSMIAKLKARVPGVQDESSLGALAKCAEDHACPLPPERMVAAFEAALSHPRPSARLQAMYGEYAWNVLKNHAIGLWMIEEAVKAAPNEPAYRITLVRMLLAEESTMAAQSQMQALQRLNIGGRLDATIHDLQLRMEAPTTPDPKGTVRP